MIYILAFAILTLGVARWTRAVSKDDITTPLRVWIDGKFGADSKISALIWCYWCSGWWWAWFWTSYTLAAAHTFGYTTWHAWLALPILAPAIAYSASWILDKEN